MKSKITILLILVFCLSLTGCELIKPSHKKTSSYNESRIEYNVSQSLTDEQLNYLIDELYISEDGLEYYDYESLNWELMGSGYELYNKTSGIEIYGLDYETDNSEYLAFPECVTNEKITLEEAVSIRNKDTDMKVEDFLKYKFQFDQYEDHDRIKLPVESYDDVYVRFTYTLDGNNVHMSTPYLECKTGMDIMYSLFADMEEFEMFYANGNKEPEDTYILTLNNTLTAKSMVLICTNPSDKDFSCDDAYAIYKGNDITGELYYENRNEGEYTLDAHRYGIYQIVFGDAGITEPGTYTIDFGGVYTTTFEITQDMIDNCDWEGYKYN